MREPKNCGFENIHYDVNPVYNADFFLFFVEGRVSVKFLDFIRFIYEYNNSQKMEEKSKIFA